MQKTVFLSLGFSSLTGSPRFLHFRSHTWRLSLLQMRLSVSHIAWWKSSFQGAEGFKVDHTGSDRRGLVTMASVPLKPRQDQQKLLCVLCLRLSLQLQRFHTWPLNATGCQSFIYVFVPWTKFVYQCSSGPQAKTDSQSSCSFHREPSLEKYSISHGREEYVHDDSADSPDSSDPRLQF